MKIGNFARTALLASVIALFAACSGVPSDGGPGPVGPVGPQDSPGPQGDVGPQGLGGNTEIIRGTGVITSRDVEVSGFQRINLGGEGRVIVTQSDRFGLRITTDDNIHEYLEVTVAMGTLTLRTSGAGAYDIEPTDSVTWEVEAPDIAGLTVGGAGDIAISDLITDHLELRLEGAGSIRASGAADSVELVVSGAGSIDATALEASTAVVSLNGVGSIALTATATVAVANTGIGEVEVHGSPQISGDLSRVTAIDG